MQMRHTDTTSPCASLETLPPEMIEHLLVALAVDGDDVRIDDVARFAAVNRRMHVIAHRTLLPMPLAMTVHLPRRLFACGEVRPTLGDALDYTREMARSSNAGYWTGLAAVVEIGRRCVLQAYVRWTWSTKVKRRNSAARPLALNTIATGPSADALASWAASSGRALMARGEPSIFGAQLHAATGKNHTLEGSNWRDSMPGRLCRSEGRLIPPRQTIGIRWRCCWPTPGLK
ncbi:hypothetical protein TW95_gp0284 [Pandoravirus inopinatum]|uniref:F-box domain protein n=1 Tax=Pandoravirus inopinatum TaxID=1605721 RepID=A0A0B5IWE3_9VIRU|nr:hypothetical protein TW95_gp0284 [Pandoravirus inopinatum]AJF97018.1 hypothetical protein [Pandoravirus inopinatum]